MAPDSFHGYPYYRLRASLDILAGLTPLHNWSDTGVSVISAYSLAGEEDARPEQVAVRQTGLINNRHIYNRDSDFRPAGFLRFHGRSLFFFIAS